MKSIYAPWRESYSQSHDASKKEDAVQKECVFCSIVAQNQDEKNFLLKRGRYSFIILNKYPYNAGHIMVIPYDHAHALGQLTKEARAEIMEFMHLSIATLENILKPHGCNVGLNLGSAAGAGIPSHLHFHVLPRWEGDTNFLPTLADTKIVSFNLHEVYEKLAPAF